MDEPEAFGLEKKVQQMDACLFNKVSFVFLSP